MNRKRATDLRAFAAQTQTRLILGGLALLFLVGGGLIWLVYGPQAATLGLICMSVGLIPVLLIWGALALMGWLAQARDDDD